MRGFRTCSTLPLVLLVVLFVSCSSNLAQANHLHRKLPSAVVVGTVYCDSCFQDHFVQDSHLISGATVAVDCEEGISRTAFHEEVKTNKNGTFRVFLPFSVSKHVKEIEGCSVKLVKSSEPYCAVASTASSTAIHLKKRTNGKHIFSAGFFTFKPLKQPLLCKQQPSVTNSNLNSLQDLIPTLPPFFNPIPNPLTPALPNLPPLPKLPPLPSLPSLPNLPSIPWKPSKEKLEETVDVPKPQFLLPPIFSTPSGVLPPNPLQPPPQVPIPFPFPTPSPPSLLPQLPPLFSLLPPLPVLPPLPGLINPTPSSPSPFQGIFTPPASVNANP